MFPENFWPENYWLSGWWFDQVAAPGATQPEIKFFCSSIWINFNKALWP